MKQARAKVGGMTAKEASLAATNLGIHQFIISQNQFTNAALPFVINYANKDTITLLMKHETVINILTLVFKRDIFHHINKTVLLCI